MTTFGGQLVGKLWELAAKWGAVTTLVSFFIYVFGYLAVRFKLTALGMGTDLAVLDERYLFEGLKFLVFVGASLPIVVLGTLPVGLAAVVLVRRADRLRDGLLRWWEQRTGPLLLALVACLVPTQLVLRQCFRFDNLLLRSGLPEPAWYRDLLLSSNDWAIQIFFAGALLGLAVSATILLALPSWETYSGIQRGLFGVLVLLVGIETLLLPVNYGVLSCAQSLPRLGETGTAELGASKGPRWLVWESDRSITYFAHNESGPRLVTEPRGSGVRVDIVGYDDLSTVRRQRAASISGSAPSDTASPSTPSLWERFALVTGIAASPRMMRDGGPEAGPVRGDLMLLTVGDDDSVRLTESGDLSSPVFLADSESLFALRGDRLVKLRPSKKEPIELATLQGAIKLIGVDREQPTILYYLSGLIADPKVAEIDLKSLQSRLLPGTLNTVQRRYLLGETRTDGTQEVSVEVNETDITKNWTELFLQKGDRPRKSLTPGLGISSRQPALSPDGRFIAFVRPGKSE